MKPLTRRRFLGQTLAAGAALVLRPGSAAEIGKPRYAIGCYTRPWDQHDYRTALDQIAAAGFKYAGIMTAKGKNWVIITPQTPVAEAAEVGNEVKKRGLQTISVYGDFKPEGPRSKSVEDLRRLIDNCAACGSPHLLLGGTAEAKLLDPYLDTIRDCCDYAANRKITMTIKPHGGQNATGAACRKLIERVNHPGFRLWYDPGNIFYYSDGALDPVEDCKNVDGLVAGMSVKDFQPPKEVLVNPGQGKVDFVKVLARLRQGGFTSGPLVIECLARGDLAAITAAARKTREFVERLVAT